MHAVAAFLLLAFVLWIVTSVVDSVSRCAKALERGATELSRIEQHLRKIASK